MTHAHAHAPSYFLADLPPEASLTARLVTEACQSLVRNRDHYLASRDTRSVLRSIATLAERWQDPEYPFLAKALEQGPRETGFSREILAAGLRDFFSELTLPNLEDWLVQDLGHVSRLDDLSSDEVERGAGRHSMAAGPRLLAHICAGNLPNPAFMSIISGLAVRSAQFVKCASGSAFLPRLFAHSIHHFEPKLAACLEIAEWKGGSIHLEEALFAEADCVTATGDDETLLRIREKAPAQKRFIGYGHRLSFAYLTREALSGAHPRQLAVHAARDVMAWDQLGCLSPHVIYVESGGSINPPDFAAMLADELDKGEKAHPRGPLSPEESAAIAIRRSIYEMREANSPETRLWRSEGSTAWTVVFETDPQFQTSCLNRFIYVKPSSNLEETLRVLSPMSGRVSTVGVAAPRTRLMEIARLLAAWGVTRVCPLGKMQKPPLWWRRDGRPVLAELVNWCDLET